MDSSGHQHCVISICPLLVAQGNCATGFTTFSHFKRASFESANTLSKCESKATLPFYYLNFFLLKFSVHFSQYCDEYMIWPIESIWMPNTYIDDVNSIETYNLIHDFDGLMYTVDKTLLYYIDVEVVFSRKICEKKIFSKDFFLYIFRLYFIVL